MCNQNFQQNITYINDETKNNFKSIDIKIVSDNRNFWKNIKPFLSEKHKKIGNLSRKDDIISKDKHIADIFNNKVAHMIRRLPIMKRINIQKC